MVSETAVTVTVTGALESQTLTVITTGAIGGRKASAQSSATVEKVNILNGLVQADLVVAMSSSTGNGSRATSNAEGSTLVNLRVNGFPMDVTPAANTEISIPGVGTVKLNEQISGGDGVHSTELTVNMIHVVLTGAVTGDIIVASAHSDVNFTPAPTTTSVTGFMTGGGRLGTGRNIATFGFNAGPRGGNLKGQLQYIDHAQGLHVHSTGITSYDSTNEPTCRTFSGPARVNDADGSFTVTFACDNGEPGVGVDTFEISVTGPGVSYSSTGLEGAPVLTGGNLQLH